MCGTGVDWNLTVYTLPPLVAAVLSAGLVRLAWDSRAGRMARTFILLTVCIGIWAAVDAIQLSLTGGLGSTLALESVGLVISAFIPTLWLLLAVEYAGYDHLLDRNVLELLLVEPVLFGLLVVTNPVHRLVVREAGLRATGPVLVLERTFGPAYAVHLLYAYLLVLVGIGLFVHVAVGRSVLHRKQAAVMCAGAVVPLGANIGTNLGLPPLPGVDLTTFAFALTALFFGVALFALDLLDLAKVAKSRLLEELGDGFLIADRDGEVVDYNGIAARVLSPTPTVGMPAMRALPTDSFDGADGELIEHDAADGRRFYDVEHTALHDHRDRRVGDVIGLRDVTDRT